MPQVNQLAWKIALACALIALGVAGRLLPHPPNFTPIAATALFAGFLLGSRWLAVLVPLSAMVVSNWFEEPVDLRVGVVIVAALCFPALLARVLQTRPSAGRLIGCAVASSLVFFVASNLAVWLFSPLYTADLSGISRCFWAAVPFLRNTLAGDLVWTMILFGPYVLVTSITERGLLRPAYAVVRKR